MPITHVLMLEDSEDDALLLEHQLRREWPSLELERVESAAGLRAALDPSRHWDVIISDYQMPSFTAIDAVRVLQASGRDLPFIVVSGTIDEERASETLRAGASDFLSKGRWARLVPAIKREVREARGRQARREVERRLGEERDRSDFAMRAAGVGVWERDLDAGTTVWSPTMQAMHGLAEGSYDGTLDAFINLLHRNDRERVRTELESRHDGAEFVLRYRVIWPDRSVHRIVRRGREFRRHDDGHRAAGIALDVTEHEQLEERFNHAQKMESVGNLAGGVAHDFNNLLTVISGYCELLAERFVSDPAARADISEIAHAAKSATVMTRQLLAFSRRQVLSPRVIPINEIVSGLRGMLTRLIEANVKLDIALADAETHVRVDPTQMEQILVNLVVNARDAMPGGGRIDIKTERIVARAPELMQVGGLADADHVKVTIADTGSGMPPHVQAQIFEPFFTTKEVGRGTGLGLSTVYGIVRQSRGNITVESQPGVGTTFVVYLPAEDPAAAHEVTPVSAARSTVGVRVLLVDDDVSLRRFSERALRELECVPVAAGSVAEAEGLVGGAEAPFDLAVIDVMMPDAGGPTLGAWLRENRPNIRILYTSGYSSEAVARAGLPAGSHFLQKPFVKSSLRQAICDALGGDKTN